MKNKLGQALGLLLIVLLVTTGFPFSMKKANAAALTVMSDTQTDQTTGALSSHTITFVTPSGIVASATTTLNWDNSTVIAGLTPTDVNILVNGASQTVSGTAGASTWGVTFTASTVSIKAQTSGTPAAASSSIVIKIGTAAGGTNRITNGSVGTTILTIAGTIADTGQIAEPVITNSIVNITATVAPTISFAISNNTLEFGTLNSGSARWATSTAGGSTVDTVAHTLIISTNSISGYNITLQGLTLTASTGTITPITGSPAASSPGSSQFGLYALESGGSASATTTANYRTAGSYYFGATSTTADLLGTCTGPTAAATYSVHYIANISPTTPAGAYATNLTYIATPLF
jgi:hypothetical protein